MRSFCDVTLEELSEMRPPGSPKHLLGRLHRVTRWVHDAGSEARGPELGKELRAFVVERFHFRLPEIVAQSPSGDGATKLLVRLADGATVETVHMPRAVKNPRVTLCISSQVGCAMDCSFCATAQGGFNRNLTTAEIVGQVWLAQRELRGLREGRAITNIVLMGMGEPLANYRNVVPAMRIFLDDLGYELSRRRVTLSTSGLVPQMYKLAQECNVALAVSLHAPNDVLRNELVPINRKHPIAELLEACWHYLDEQNGRSITFEYVMLDGVNDSDEDARRLAKLVQQYHLKAKVNLIPHNPAPELEFNSSPLARILKFQQILNDSGVDAFLRRPRGQGDSDAYRPSGR